MLCVGDMIISKMDTAPPLKEFRVSLAFPDDCLALYHMWCLGKNALSISPEQTRLAVCLLYVQLCLLLQFSSDADHLRVSIRFHRFKGMVPQKTMLICYFRCQLQVLGSLDCLYTSDQLAINPGVPMTPSGSVIHQNNSELRITVLL